MKTENNTPCHIAFEAWVKNHNDAEIKWIGHSYANAYMAAQWEGFKAAYQAGKNISVDYGNTIDTLYRTLEQIVNDASKQNFDQNYPSTMKICRGVLREVEAEYYPDEEDELIKQGQEIDNPSRYIGKVF